MIRIFPVVTEASKDKLVDAALIAPRQVTVSNGISVLTAPYRFGEKIDILGLSNIEALINQGIIDQCDIIDAAVLMDTVYFKDVALGTLAFEIHNQPYATFHFTEGNYRTLQVDGAFTAKNLSGDTWIKFKLTGSLNLELGHLQVLAEITAASNNLVMDELEALGYDIHATRTNPNRRPHGRTKAENASING